MSAFGGKADIGRLFRRIGSPAGGACYFFVIIVIRHETAAAARWALLLIVRTLFNDAITVAVWTGFHVCLPVDTSARLPRQEPQFSSMLASLIIFPQKASCALMKSPSPSKAATGAQMQEPFTGTSSLAHRNKCLEQKVFPDA
jgi:hypothetical protein